MITQHHPNFLREAPDQVRRSFASCSTRFHVSAGSQILLLGQCCKNISFLDQGCVRVYLVGVDGREITLYRIHPQESCVLTAASILGDTPFPASAAAEMECSGWLVPKTEFSQWVSQHDFWRRFVFQMIAQRLAAVLGRLEQTAFTRLDARLAGCLLGRCEPDGTLRTTQQDLADELASAREAIGRLLNRWSHSGWVRLQRGQILIQDRAALQSLFPPT